MAAPLQDIWQYAFTTPDVVGKTGGGGGESGGSGDVQTQYAPLASDNPAIQKLIDQGIISRVDQKYSNESGSGEFVQNQVKWDPSVLPQMGPPGVGNKFGNWMPADPNRMTNSSLVYNDPNYGPITPTFNDKANTDTGWEKYIGPVIMGVGGLAAGAALGPGLASALTSVPSAAHSFGSSGNLGGILGLLGGIGGGLLGVPGASSIGKLAGSVAGSALSPKASSSAAPTSAAPKMTPQQMFAQLPPQAKAQLLMQYASKSGNVPVKGK
jgi:hypothetical protein